MMQETNDPEERKQYADIVEENNRLLLQLISDILDLSKIEAGTFDINPKEMEARQLCTDLVNSFQGKAKTGVEILLAPDLPELYLVSDKNRLNQVLINFITNAIKFTFQGNITIGYEVREKK